jgi:hypothetical protein
MPKTTIIKRHFKQLLYRIAVNDSDGDSRYIYRTELLWVWNLVCHTREEHRLRVFENRVLRGVFGSERDGVTGSGEDYITRNLMICTDHQILVG